MCRRGLRRVCRFFFGIPSAAEEKTGEIDGLQLYGLRNPETFMVTSHAKRRYWFESGCKTFMRAI